mgnify:CR=1 FL=1
MLGGGLPYLAEKQQIYLDKGYSEYEARAAMVRDGDLEVHEEFLNRDIEIKNISNKYLKKKKNLKNLKYLM